MDADEKKCEELMKQGKAGKLSLKDAHWLAVNGHVPEETMVKLMDPPKEGNMYEHMAQEMEKDS